MIACVRRAMNPPVPRQPDGQLPLWGESMTRIAVNLRHSRRARRVAVRIGLGGQVELVVPRGVSVQQARAFLDSRAEWVRQHLARRCSAMPPAGEFPPRVLQIPLLQESWRIFVGGGTGRARLVVCGDTREGSEAGAAAAGGVLELRGQGTATDWRRCLLSWLRRRALAALGARLHEAAQRHGFTFSKLSIRHQRTRWGSCSVRGAISLNLALLFQREDVVRYLLCHELAHTRHMNHSRHFWQCVASCEPRWRELDAALLQGWRHVPRWMLEPA
jgi:predicted metal-dependent hydrolase